MIAIKNVLNTYVSKEAGRKALAPYLHLFPIKPSVQLAMLVADLICDGHVQGAPRWRIDYSSGSIEELNRFEKEIHDLFGVKGKIRSCKGNKWSTSYNYGLNCAPITRYFI